MAKALSSIAMNITFLFTISLLILSISVESGTVFRGFVEPKASLQLQCNRVHGVKSGDTCFALAQTFKLSTGRFTFINPNINCSDLFIGQWVCVNGFLI